MDEPLLFLPGMMCDSRLFAPQLGRFSATRPVCVIPPTGARQMSDLARLVLDHAPPRFALAGLSMGGIIAMEVVRQSPERVTRLALMDTNPLADPPEKTAARAAQVARVDAGGLRQVMKDELKPNYLAPGPSRQPILELCMSMAEALGPDTFKDQAHAISTRPDQQETLKALSVPTLVLCGEHDGLCPVERHELMHALVPGSVLEIIPNAGHMPTLEQPDHTNEALEKWLHH